MLLHYRIVTGSNFPLPPTHKHKKYSYSFHNVSLSIRADKELLQTHDSSVKFDLPSINDWPSNFLENYPQGFYRASFLNFSPGTSSSPVTLPCMYVHGARFFQKFQSAKFISVHSFDSTLYLLWAFPPRTHPVARVTRCLCIKLFSTT